MSDSLIIIPTYKNKQGNPVLFSSSFKEKIMTIGGDVGAKKILDEYKKSILNLEVNSPSILKNYNTPETFDN